MLSAFILGLNYQSMQTYTFDLQKQHYFTQYFYKTYFLFHFNRMNELLWQDAFLFDFLQKKTLNKWVQKFLIISAYLFNERQIFDFLIRFCIDFVFTPLHKLSLFELTSVSTLLTWILNFLFLNFLFLFFFA